jgi:hypothetical protein
MKPAEAVKKDMGKCVTSKCQWILYLDEIPCGRDGRVIEVLSQDQFRAQQLNLRGAALVAPAPGNG